jgi:hypothetical protein
MLETSHLLGCKIALKHVGSKSLREQLDRDLGGRDTLIILCIGLINGHPHEVSKGTSMGCPILIHDDLHPFQMNSSSDIQDQCGLDVNISLHMEEHELAKALLCLDFHVNIAR